MFDAFTAGVLLGALGGMSFTLAVQFIMHRQNLSLLRTIELRTRAIDAGGN